MRIAFLNTLYPPYGPLGGAEATMGVLVNGLAARGHECSVVTLTPGRHAYRRQVDGTTVHYLPLANVYWPHGGRRPRALRPAFQFLDAYNPVMRHRLAHVLAELKPDVVHAHNLQGFSVSAWAAAKSCAIPLVQTLHDYYVACPRSTMWRPGRGNCAQPCWECRVVSQPRRHLSRLPSLVTSVSHRVLERVRAAGLFEDTGARIIRGNNVAAAVASGGRRPGRTLRLGFLGRLEPAKGLECLLDALVGIPAQRVALAIGGSGPPTYEAELKRRAAGMNNVEFLGRVTPGTFLPLLDLLVIPSAWEDPLPRVFHEALSYGVPSLVMPSGGLPECIQHGRNGFVAPSIGVAGIREVVLTLLLAGWDGATMRGACLEQARYYAPERITAEYEEVLDEARQGHGALPPIPASMGPPLRAEPSDPVRAALAK